MINKEMISDFLIPDVSFLTVQVCILILLKHTFDINILNLHFLSFVIFLGGCYITYVKQFLIYKKYDISGKVLHISNVIFHIIPFLYIWMKYKLNKKYILETLLFVVIYVYMYNPKKKYFISDKEYRIYIMYFVLVTVFFYIVI